MPSSYSAPFSPVLGLDHLLRLRSDQLAFYADMQARHGDIVRLRLGPYRLWLLFHPDQIEEVLTEKPEHFVRFRRMMSILAQWNGQSLFIAEGQKWRERRRQVLPAFATRRMPSYADLVVSEVEDMCSAWKTRSQSGELTVETDAEMAVLFLRIALTTLFGRTSASDDGRIGEAVAALSDVAFKETTNPIALPDWLPLPIKRKKRWAIATFLGTVEQIIADRLSAGGEDTGDLLSTLIEHTGGELEPLRNEAVSLLIAGHETSGAALSWASYLLSTHPKTLEHVLNEVDALSSFPLRFENVEDLPYLKAVVFETLRLHPPGYVLFTREVATTCRINGIEMKPGDLVQILPCTTQRDARWFDDPNEFIPDRFLEEPTWPRCAYIPFGTGPRVCIGQNFGLMETVLGLATILRQFRPNPPKYRVTAEAKFSLRPHGGLPQVWRLRD